jgi:hypothetical protein
MAKPPADADPELFIVGRGGYDNFRTARPYHDSRVFRIDPTPMPVWSIVAYDALFAAASFGFHWLLKHATHGASPPWAVYGAPLGIGVLTCVGFTAIAYYSFAKARRLGPWLIYDKATGRVELPREGVSFDREQIVHVQYITTKLLDWGGVMNNERRSELNLVTCRDARRQRWPVLRSCFTVKAFDHILRPLLENTDLSVVRVEDQWWGWQVTQKPYGGPPGRPQSPSRPNRTNQSRYPRPYTWAKGLYGPVAGCDVAPACGSVANSACSVTPTTRR